MHCAKCGTDVPDESRFCPKCGAQLQSDAAAGDAVPPADRLRDMAGARSGDDDDKEHELWRGSYSGKAMIGSYVLAGLASIGLLAAWIYLQSWGMVMLVAVALIWIALGLVLAYKKLSVHYELTNQRFIHRLGILTRVTDRIEVIDIDDVTFQQGIIQRLFGVGTIKVTSSDRTHPELHLHGIDDVVRVADMMDDVRRQERRRRGLHIEAI